MKLSDDDDRIGERDLRLLVASELDVDHLVRRRRRHMNTGAGKRNQKELGNLIGVILKWNHEARHRDDLIVQISCRGTRLSRTERLQRRPGYRQCGPRGRSKEEQARRDDPEQRWNELHT